jgi:hypothetical protein
MKKDIPEIINTALELDNNLLGEYFVLHQKESCLKPELFFGMLMAELKTQRKKLVWQGFDLDGFMRLASQFNILEEFLNNQLILVRETNENSSGTIWTPSEGLTSKDLPPYIEAVESDCTNSDHLKFLEKISEGLLKEDLKIDDAITGTKNPDVQDKDSQKPVFENKINRMPIDQVRIFFTPLIETKNKNGDNWMEPEAFEIFIRRSFAKEESLSKPDINLGKGTKGAIIELFYQFYRHCVDKNHISRRDKKPFVKLLRDAFNTGIFNNLDDDSFNDKAKWGWPDFKSKV